jgi:hypothetical protein
VSSGGARVERRVRAGDLALVSLRIELSARVDRWDNSDGHSISSTPTITATTVASRQRRLRSRLAWVRCRLRRALVARRYRASPRAESGRAVSQAGEPHVDHRPESIPQGGKRRGSRSRLRLAANRVRPTQGHVLVADCASTSET